VKRAEMEPFRHRRAESLVEGGHADRRGGGGFVAPVEIREGAGDTGREVEDQGPEEDHRIEVADPSDEPGLMGQPPDQRVRHEAVVQVLQSSPRDDQPRLGRGRRASFPAPEGAKGCRIHRSPPPERMRE